MLALESLRIFHILIKQKGIRTHTFLFFSISLSVMLALNMLFNPLEILYIYASFKASRRIIYGIFYVKKLDVFFYSQFIYIQHSAESPKNMLVVSTNTNYCIKSFKIYVIISLLSHLLLMSHW